MIDCVIHPKRITQSHQFLGVHSEEVTPDPIPNSEAKCLSADGTVGVPTGE